MFNFCFTDAGECMHDLLKIMSRCEVFCLFCKLVTKIAVELIGILKVNLVSAKTDHS